MARRRERSLPSKGGTPGEKSPCAFFETHAKDAAQL